MSSWFKKDMGDGIEAYKPSMILHRKFLGLAVEEELPEGIGVFSVYDIKRNIVTWFFTPETSALAEIFDAEPCEKPVPKKGFGLLVGNATSWKLHFPNFIK